MCFVEGVEQCVETKKKIGLLLKTYDCEDQVVVCLTTVERIVVPWLIELNPVSKMNAFLVWKGCRIHCGKDTKHFTVCGGRPQVSTVTSDLRSKGLMDVMGEVCLFANHCGWSFWCLSDC